MKNYGCSHKIPKSDGRHKRWAKPEPEPEEPDRDERVEKRKDIENIRKERQALENALHDLNQEYDRKAGKIKKNIRILRRFCPHKKCSHNLCNDCGWSK